MVKYEHLSEFIKTSFNSMKQGHCVSEEVPT